MQLTIDGREVEIPAGQYGDEDDLMCRGCGRELPVWSNHTLMDCLVTLRQQIEELNEKLKEKLDPTEVKV